MRRITIPLIIDVLMVDDPAQIAILDANPAVTRNFAKSQSWAVRWLGMRLRKALSIGNTLFPALLPREDLIRRGQTEALQRRFGPKGENAVIARDDLQALARYVRGEADEAAMIMQLQSVVGRQFSPDYKATRQTVLDAALLDGAARHFAKGFWLRLTGQIAPARRRMAQACDGDIYAAHATVVALQSLAVPMRGLRRRFDTARNTAGCGPEVAAAVIEPPPHTLRTLSGPVEAPFLSRPLGPKSLLIFTPRPSAGPDVAFAMGRWSQCPAHAFVLRLLEEVWCTAMKPQTETSAAA